MFSDLKETLKRDMIRMSALFTQRPLIYLASSPPPTLMVRDDQGRVITWRGAKSKEERTTLSLKGPGPQSPHCRRKAAGNTEQSGRRPVPAPFLGI